METRIEQEKTGGSELASRIRECFALQGQDLRTYSPLTLAFLGDGVYDLVIRTILVEKGNCSANKLHREKSAVVKAASQAKMAEALLPELTAEELAVYKRGRNAKSVTVPKNAEISDYRKATGFEALMGYLYLKDETERIFEDFVISLVSSFFIPMISSSIL